MSPSRLSLALAAALALAACGADAPVTPAGSSAAHAPGHTGGHGATPAGLARQLVPLRQATAAFHDFDRAAAAGYATAITPCWEHRTRGAMGYHYADTTLIDGTVSLLEPEVLMYEPQPGGHLRLVGMEYIVPIDAWEGVSPPTLLGQEFHPHSFLPIYKLHIWLWRDNPRGIFADWNPQVSCVHAAETDIFD